MDSNATHRAQRREVEDDVAQRRSCSGLHARIRIAQQLKERLCDGGVHERRAQVFDGAREAFGARAGGGAHGGGRVLQAGDDREQGPVGKEPRLVRNRGKDRRRQGAGTPARNRLGYGHVNGFGGPTSGLQMVGEEAR